MNCLTLTIDFKALLLVSPEHWMLWVQTQETIRNSPRGTDEEQTLQETMVERYKGILSGMEEALKTIQARKTPQTPPRVYNNRK